MRNTKFVIVLFFIFLFSVNVYSKRIAVVPFLYNTFEYNDTDKLNIERVWIAIDKVLKEKGYETIPLEEIKKAMNRLKIGKYKLSTRETERLAREVGTDEIITGEIVKYLGYKGFSLSEFFITDASIILKAKKYSVSKQLWSWKQQASAYKKYKISGIFKKKGLLLRATLKEVVDKLLKTINK